MINNSYLWLHGYISNHTLLFPGVYSKVNIILAILPVCLSLRSSWRYILVFQHQTCRNVHVTIFAHAWCYEQNFGVPKFGELASIRQIRQIYVPPILPAIRYSDMATSQTVFHHHTLLFPGVYSKVMKIMELSISNFFPQITYLSVSKRELFTFHPCFKNYHVMEVLQSDWLSLDSWLLD